MDLWYGSRANVKNQISTIAKNEVSLFHREPNTLILELHKWDKKTSLTKIDKLEGFLKQVITNNKELVVTFKEILVLLKNMDGHMATLVQKIWFFSHSWLQFQPWFKNFKNQSRSTFQFVAPKCFGQNYTLICDFG